MRGGKRQGAGRPKKNSRVLFKRVPAEHYDEIKARVEEMTDIINNRTFYYNYHAWKENDDKLLIRQIVSVIKRLRDKHGFKQDDVELMSDYNGYKMKTIRISFIKVK